MSHAQLERDRLALRAAIVEEKARHEAADKDLRRKLQEVEATLQVQAAGIDRDLVAAAEQVLYVHGSLAAAGQDRLLQLEAALRDLLTGCRVLRDRYIGTKDYEHWHGQAENHTYGYGPKHGSMIFQIGLLPAVRQRPECALSEDELEACAYYLRNLERIQAARAAAQREAQAA